MTDKFNKRKKNFLALLLSLLMVSSTAVSFVACNQETDDETNDDTTTSTVETDTARINNGSFEFVDTEDKTTLIYTSPTGWSKDTSGASAASSSAKSGIVNVEEKAWKNFTQSALVGVDAPETAEAAKASWDSMSAFDKLTFYKAWEDADHKEDVEDLDFYDADTDDFNVDIDDVPAFEVNPGVHTGAADGDTHVFMIHNARADGFGTAQKYASSTTVTVAANTSAKFSLWVKTAALKSNGDDVLAHMGAYIGVTHTVGGTTLDQFQVKNIVADEWTQYEFYLRGCSFASSTFKIVLGLGQGSNDNKLEYVEGYAFFDDVTCTLIDNNAYATEINGWNTNDKANNIVGLSDEGPEKQLDVGVGGAHYGKTKFALDLYADFSNYALTGFSRELTTQEKDGTTYVAGTGKYNNGYSVPKTLNGGFSTDNDVVELFDNPTALMSAANTSEPLKNRLVKDFGYDATKGTFSEKYNALFGNSKVLVMLSYEGANYTAKITDSDFTLAKGERIGISFFMKTSDFKGKTGITVTARNNDVQSETATLSSLSTTSITKVDLEDEQKDVFDGWQQVFVFVENNTDRDNLSFTLEISYGPTDVDTDAKNFYAGYAAMTGFCVAKDMTEAAYGYASTGTYATKLSLSAPDADDFTGIQFDSAKVVPTNAIENGLAWLMNYTGVFADSGYVSATGTNNVKNDDTLTEGDDNQYAGLFSKDYLENYAKVSDANYWLNAISGVSAMDETAKTAFLKGLLGTGSNAATQPLIIVNETANKSYGFIGATTTLAADGYKTVSVRVKVSAGATATVYLTDTDDLTHESVVGISRQVSYWYDKDGNVCVSDPTESGFNPTTDVAFELQANGLYKANPSWTNYNSLTAEQKTAYFANLANYERETDKDGNVNLLVADGGVQYNYDGAWDGEGLDGIAYYGDAFGNFYADKAKTVKVLDFAAVNATETLLNPRYAAAGEQSLAVTVGNTNGAWQTVTFHVHAGSQAKNFRLEVWSGDRDGNSTNTAGSYVLFDGNQIDDSTSDTWTTRLDGAIADVLDANNWTEDEFKAEYTDVIYNAYSFYDSAKFLRYNADLDKNELTSSYDNFDPTDKTLYDEIVSYMRADADGITTVFADYAQTDKEVAVDVDPSEDEEDDGDDGDDTTTDDGMNVWLLISSLVIAIALIIAVVALILRKAFAKARKAKARAAAANPASVRKPVSVKSVKAAKPAKKDEPKDEGDPYND